MGAAERFRLVTPVTAVDGKRPDPLTPASMRRTPLVATCQESAGRDTGIRALDDAGRVDLLLSPGMTGHLRDAAYHLVDDPSAGDTWDEAALDLLAELGHALSDALDLLRVREG